MELVGYEDVETRIHEALASLVVHMARLRYCQKTYFGYCNADDADVERCPYLKAIEEIARLSVENSQLEDDLK